MHRPIDPPTPWLRLIGLGIIAAACYATAWATNPENRPTRDHILTTLKSAL